MSIRKRDVRSERLTQEPSDDYRTVFELAGIGMAQADPATGRFLQVNPKMCEVTGYSERELLGMTFVQLTHPDDREQDLTGFQRTLHGESPEYTTEKRYVRKDGSVAWVHVNVRVVRDDGGRALRTVANVRDITEHKKADDSLRLLGEAAELLSSPLDYRARLRNLARLVATTFADWCAVEVLEDGGLLKRIAVEHADPRKIDLGLQLQERYPDDPDAAYGVPNVLRTGEPEMMSEVPGELLDEAARDAEHRRLLAELGIRSYMLVPMVAQGRTLGVISFVAEDVGRRYDAKDLSVAETLARRAAMAIDNARLYEEAQREIAVRKRAEQEIERAHHRQSIVAALGMRALKGTDLQAVLDEAVALVAAALGVEYCKVLELSASGETLLMRAGVGWADGLVGTATVEAGLDSQAGYTLLSDEPVIVEDLGTEGRFDGPPLLRDHGIVSGMSVIIGGREHPFGVLGAHSKHRRSFSEDDTNFLQAVANVLATAVDRKEVEERLDKIRESERERMARDLHDEVLQDLAYALAAAQVIQDSWKERETKAQLDGTIEAIKRAGQGVRAAIYDLGLEEKREEGLADLLDSLVDLNRRRWPGCRIELSVEEDLPSETLPRAAVVEVVRIVGEALTNSRRHSGARNVRVTMGTSKGTLWAQVEDDGEGFGSDASTGTGLKGMRERALAMGGELLVEGARGRGTKVRFELDLDKHSEDKPGETARVLLVDDHASFRDAVASVFDREPGFAIVNKAGSLAEARGLLDGVDVAVVDLSLPDGFGGDLIKELRSRNPQAQALVLSGTLDRAEAARAVESGAAGILDKAVGIEQVMEAVRRLRRGETLMAPEEVVELLRFAVAQKDEEHEARWAIERLTEREKEVLGALAEGLNSPQIAERLGISVKTEHNHMASVLAKLGVSSRLQALVFALRHGLVEVH